MTIFGLLSPDGRWLWVSLIHLKVAASRWSWWNYHGFWVN